MRELNISEINYVHGGAKVTAKCGKSTTTTVTKNADGSSTTETVVTWGCEATLEK